MRIHIKDVEKGKELKCVGPNKGARTSNVDDGLILHFSSFSSLVNSYYCNCATKFQQPVV